MSGTRAMSALSAKTGAALLTTAAADFLFFAQPLGVSVAIFGALLAVAIVAVHPAAFAGRLPAAPTVLAAGTLLPLAENLSGLSLSVAMVGLSGFALSVSGRLRTGPADVAGRIAAFLLAAPLRLPGDLGRARTAAARTARAGAPLGGVAIWTMPVVLGTIFLILFGMANPVIGYWLSLIDLRALLDLLDVRRIALWLAAATLAWAFLRPRLPKRRRRPASPAAAAVPSAPAAKTAAALRRAMLGKAAILRALLVFNALFAMQTALDGSYLWAGAALPNGLTYASYAHRGAYPLVVTALLAAVFVLATMRPGSAPSTDGLIRKLVYLWIAQNVVLMISSILRLDLYIHIYSLTYWRVAAFIWMGLVAAGLVLIMVYIALGRSNEWLLSANLVTLSATLYACCFINFAAIIADYNVAHSREMDGGGLGLDFCYLRSLGAAAIPAMDKVLKTTADTDSAMNETLAAERASATDDLSARQSNWRSWSFRGWRLARYLDSHPDPARPAVPGPAW